jgi:hypothetical protein
VNDERLRAENERCRERVAAIETELGLDPETDQRGGGG